MKLTAGFRLGRIFGIELILAWSLLLAFALIAGSLASIVFPRWHPDWSAGLIWATSSIAAALFLASILLHELAHAVTGRWFGTPVRRITLFLFGGMAQLDHEPRTWQAELSIAAAGPACSLALGLLCLYAAEWIGGPFVGDPAQPQAILAAMGPATSLLLWLGSINIILAIFNLVPAFPLDGGRILRALMWGASGDLLQATRWAALSGQAFGWVLAGAGFLMLLGTQLPYLGGGLIGGLWLMLIGWFLHQAAQVGTRQLLVRHSLQQVPVAELMRTDLIRVDPHLQIKQLFDHGPAPAAVAVEDHGRFVGLVSGEDLSAHPAPPDTAVEDIMTPSERLPAVTPQQEAFGALQQMNGRGLSQLPVVDGDRLVGLLQREDVLQWLLLRLRQARAA